MRYVQPKKLKVMMIAFFGTGIWGISFGLYMGSLVSLQPTPNETNYFLITLLGVINLCLGAFCGFVLLMQEPKLTNKKKKKKDR